MPHMMVPSFIPRMPVDLPVAHIERPHQYRQGAVPGVAPLAWPGEPYWPEINEDRPTGPYRVNGVDPYWLGKIAAGTAESRVPETIPLTMNVPTMAMAPWRKQMILPPERVGPFTMRVYDGRLL